MKSVIPHSEPIRHLYIHIPFCHRRCSYCDFNTYVNMEDRIEAYCEALCHELAMLEHDYAGRWRNSFAGAGLPARGPLLRSQLKPSVFFGGGTPSMIPLKQMEQILQAIDRLIPLEIAEVSLEANPGTVLGRDYLSGLRSIGFNRISMGVQSLHDPTLRMLGRIHTAQEAFESYQEARRAGFDNINLDFIFGLPNQTLEQWRWTLDQITQWGCEHFSLYSLILEENTPLYAQVTSNRLSVPDDDQTGEMYELAMERFAAAGYVQYEISNWAKTTAEPLDRAPYAVPTYACHHNLAYWLNADYGAAGAGAHGHIFPQRYADVLRIDDYIATVRKHERPIAETTPLDHDDLCSETVFMGLRLNTGLGLEHFRQRCGQEIDEVYGETISNLIDLGLLERDELAIRLTPRGRMLGNQVFSHFV